MKKEDTSKNSIFRPTKNMVVSEPLARPETINKERNNAAQTLIIAGILGFISSLLSGLFTLVIFTVVSAAALSPNSSLSPVAMFVMLGVALSTAILVTIGALALRLGRFREAYYLAIVASLVAALPLVVSFLAAASLIIY